MEKAGHMRRKENYLDYVPKHNCLFQSQVNEKGLVEITVENKGIYNRLAQLFFHRPKVSQIELERFGSFVWNCIDGKRSIFEIGKLVEKKIGAEAKPLYPRLARYCKIRSRGASTLTVRNFSASPRFNASTRCPAAFLSGSSY